MRVGATWTWNGNISDPVIDSGGDSVWCPGEPNGDGTCGDSFPCEGQYTPMIWDVLTL